MGKKRKRNNKRVNPPEINKRILNGFLDMESDAGNMMELFGGFWPLIEKKEQDILNIRDRTKVPQLDFRSEESRVWKACSSSSLSDYH